MKKFVRDLAQRSFVACLSSLVGRLFADLIADHINL